MAVGTPEGSEVEPAVIVVGAGISGLVAAQALVRDGVQVIVLESSGRVGGRALTETSVLGSRVDLGGQWIGHDHHHLLSLLADLDLSHFQMYSTAMPRLLDGGRSFGVAHLRLAPALIAAVTFGLVSQLGAPARWNDVSLRSRIARVPGKASRRLLEILAGVAWTCDLDDYSLGASAELLKAQGGLRTMISTRGGAQDAMVLEGMGAVAERLAAELGDRVRRGERVESIDRDGSGVSVRTGSRVYHAERVIVAVPPPKAAEIVHTPELPENRTLLEQTTAMGTVYKAIAVYDRPFWRRYGMTDLVVLDAPGRAIFDTGRSDDESGHLCILVPGHEGHALKSLSPVERQRTLLSPLEKMLGPQIQQPKGWHDAFWDREESVGGGYIALPRRGTSAGIPPVSYEAAGRLHWAGAEHARQHPGYIDGAIESGRRAADEVLAMLQAPASL